MVLDMSKLSFDVEVGERVCYETLTKNLDNPDPSTKVIPRTFIGRIKKSFDFRKLWQQWNRVNKPHRTIILLEASFHKNISEFDSAKKATTQIFTSLFDAVKSMNRGSPVLEIQICVFRSYSSKPEEILNPSKWQRNAESLVEYLETITFKKEWSHGAVEVGLAHAVKEYQTDPGQVIVVTFAAPYRDQIDTRRRESPHKRGEHEEAVDFEEQLHMLAGTLHVPVHMCFLSSRGKEDFDSRKLPGSSMVLDIKGNYSSFIDTITAVFLSGCGNHGEAIATQRQHLDSERKEAEDD